MRRLCTGLAVTAAMSWYTLTATAQNSLELYPIQQTVVQTTTTTTYAPPGGWNFPGSNAPLTASTTWEPAETVNYTPAVNYTPPVNYTPAVNYSAAVNYAPAANYAPATGYPPAVSYAPAVAYAPTVVGRPVQPVVYTPVAARYPAQPFVKYTPVVARYPAQPYVAYAPVANDYLAAAAAAHPGKTVWVHPKVYVEGQPIRNVLRAITP